MRLARVLLYVLLGSFVATIAVAAMPTAAATACAPDVRITTRVLARDRGNAASIQVNLQAAATAPGGDRLVRVNIGSATNATVETDGQRAALPSVITLNPTVPTWSFVVRVVAPGVPHLVTFTATDLCGEVSKFVGAGSGAGIAPATATPTQTQPTVAPTSPTINSPLTVFGDALGASWGGTPWSGTVNMANASPVHQGTRSIAFTATSAWGGISLHHADVGVDTSRFTHAAFALRASQAGQRIGVALHGADYQVLGSRLPLVSYGGDAVATAWKEYRIPLADFQASGRVVKGISFQDLTGSAQPPIYIDTVQFASAGASTPPSATSTPVATSTPIATSTPVPTAIPTQTIPVTDSRSPVQLATFYRPLSDGTTEADLARVAGAAVLTRTDEGHRDRLRAAGFGGPITQYLLAFETSGPEGLANGSAACGWYQPYVNNMSGISGDFCTALHGDERNFLHNGRGERLYATQSWQENGATKRAYLYLMNPGAPGWRAYAARRVREEAAALGYSGIFLDNVDLSLYRGQRQEANSDGAVAEYATNAAFQEAVAGFLQQVKAGMGGAKLWANMASGTDAPDDWDRYAPHLDGFMSEYFVARWGGTYPSPAVWETQLRQAEAAVAQGKTFLAVGQGSKTDAARMRFALASYLLAAGDGVTFRYGDASGGEATSPGYYQLWRYAEYDARLGAPTSPRYQSGSLWRRDFACGHVTADPGSHIGTIVVDPTRPGCS